MWRGDPQLLLPAAATASLTSVGLYSTSKEGCPSRRPSASGKAAAARAEQAAAAIDSVLETRPPQTPIGRIFLSSVYGESSFLLCTQNFPFFPIRRNFLSFVCTAQRGRRAAERAQRSPLQGPPSPIPPHPPPRAGAPLRPPRLPPQWLWNPLQRSSAFSGARRRKMPLPPTG